VGAISRIQRRTWARRSPSPDLLWGRWSEPQ